MSSSSDGDDPENSSDNEGWNRKHNAAPASSTASESFTVNDEIARMNDLNRNALKDIKSEPGSMHVPVGEDEEEEDGNVSK